MIGRVSLARGGCILGAGVGARGDGGDVADFSARHAEVDFPGMRPGEGSAKVGGRGGRDLSGEGVVEETQVADACYAVGGEGAFDFCFCGAVEGGFFLVCEGCFDDW